MYKVIINKGKGFTEIIKHFDDLNLACIYAIDFGNVEIYKNKKRIF